MSTNEPVVFITGANTGLGLEAVKALLAESEGFEILLGTRTLKNGEQAIEGLKSIIASSKSTVTPLQVDVSSDESIEAAFSTISKQFGRLDVLVNNAGVNTDLDIQKGMYGKRQGFDMMWNVNVVGAHITTETFMPLLIKSPQARIIFITSGTSSISETEIHDGHLARINTSPPAGWPKPEEANPILGYRSSKAGLNMLMTQWHRVVKNDGIKVFAVSPGFLATNLAGVGVDTLKKFGAIEPHIGGEFLRDVIVGRRDDQTGKVIRKDATQSW